MITKSAKIKIGQFLDFIDSQRTSRLSRGNVRSQKGFQLSERKWKDRKNTQEEKIADISKAFCPEKYPS